MTQAVIAGVALIAGVLLGFWMRGNAAKTEKALLEQKAGEATQSLATAQKQLAEAQAESAARAGFEKLAAERERTLAAIGAERDAVREELRTAGETVNNKTGRISALEKELENERKNIAEKLALLEEAKTALANQFQALAGEILEQKSKNFSEASQKELQPLLNPLREQIKEFREKVEKAQLDSSNGVTKLETLIGTLGNLNQALTKEAHNLSTALRRDTKMQGNWGETILRNILDKSGLQEGTHYSFQESFTESGADGEPTQRRQTDVLVKLPGGRHLIIDSKVSLNSYQDSVNAESDGARADAIKKHLLSVRNHYNELSSRNYHALSGVQSPDFVVMFVPIEPAFLLALQNDEGIWQDSYSKGVLLSGPTTILFVIRIVEDLWGQDQKVRNVDEVIKRGSELYDKFVGFVTNLESVGNAILDARNAYDEALKQLSTGPGNLVRQVEMLRQLGVPPKATKTGPKVIPAKLIEMAGAEPPTLALAAESEDAPNEVI